MRRQVTLKTKVLGGPNDAASEKRLPITIHRHATCQWIRRGHEPFGQREPVLRRILRQWRQKGWHSRRHLFLGLKKFASMMDEGGTLLSGGAFLHHQGRRNFRQSGA